MNTLDSLQALFETRIAVLDGAMGSMIQSYTLQESDFRGDLFKTHAHDLKGDNDLLNLTRPDVIEDIHRRYLEAGADIIETNTFSSTAIAQADYQMQDAVRAMNFAAVKVAKKAVAAVELAQPGRRCFIAGNLGPLNRTLSLSPDVNRPDYRAVTWKQVVEAYAEQARCLVEGGVDALLVETIFDTLNAKAAIFAIEETFDTLGKRVPIMISVTITDASGRTLSGQTLSAFYASIRHARPFSVGINCALGGRQMRPYIEELSGIAECYVTCHPNAGLPNAFGAYEETPEDMAKVLGAYAREGFLNLAGGCCGSTPDHIRAIAQAVRGLRPRKPLPHSERLSLSGLEAFAMS
jgi:5-methyltetrahydrofolate--homocysteine methyltransferase